MNEARYELGVMDLYPIVCNNTEIENNPYFQVTLKEKVYPERLYGAVKLALELFPLFGCTIKHHKKYYLETNHKDFQLINKAPEERPLEFGDNTNGFLWQMCYHESTITFEWCHAVSDGRGGIDFFSAVLCNYFDEPYVMKTEATLELGYESVADKTQPGIPQKKQPSDLYQTETPVKSCGQGCRRGFLRHSHNQHL